MDVWCPAMLIGITDLNRTELWPFSGISETRLYRAFEPQPGIFVAESPKVIGRALDAGYQPLSMLVDCRLAEGTAKGLICRCGDIPVYTAPYEQLSHLVGFHLTQGVLCAMRRRELPDEEAVCLGAARVAVLENVMNPANVGAIFRSAAALGFDAVLLTPGCSDPLYRRCIRVSMGTVFQIPWTYLKDSVPDYVDELKRMGYISVAMALREDSVGVDDPRFLEKEKLAVILGSEGEGLSDETISACDYTARIPMAHGVDSLNVAAASAVAFWQMGRR